MSLSLWPDGVAGISREGVFGALPSWVDPKKAPGHTSQVHSLGFKKWVWTVATLRHMFMAPNLVWFCMALALHVFCPYNFEAAKEGFAAGWLLKRFALNFAVAFVYYAYFFYWLYISKATTSVRKYRPNTYPTFGNMMHNMWYWSLAIVQWTWWEAVMVRLWATGVVSFVTLDDMLADPRILALNVLAVLLIPVWRDVHFYVAHRFLHIRAIYTYVHKLHHRNADPEPFSGMTMHPIEHLYYFSNAFTPSLYLMNLSPLVFTWNFIHLVIAPGASHSGYEDHFHSDQYHFVHHAKFECNYGGPLSGFIDQALGTFRESLGTSEAYVGEWTEKNDDNIAANKKDDDLKKKKAAATAIADAKSKSNTKPLVWAPHSYLGLPARYDHGIYTLYWCSLFPLVWIAATKSTTTLLAPSSLPVTLAGVPFASVVAVVVAYSPPVVAVLCSRLVGDRMSWRWPFQKESILGVFGLLILLSWAVCILPIYHATLYIVQLG